MKTAEKKQRGNENDGESAPSGHGRATQDDIAELLSELGTAPRDFESESGWGSRRLDLTSEGCRAGSEKS